MMKVLFIIISLLIKTTIIMPNLEINALKKVLIVKFNND